MSTRTKKTVWVNPSFLDYRIPLYKELLSVLGGNFSLIYGRELIPKRCDVKVKEALADNALPVTKHREIAFGHSSGMANDSLTIFIPKGLYGLISRAKPDLLIAEGYFKFSPWAVAYAAIHRIPLLIAYERTAHTERHCPWPRKLYRRFINLFVDGYLANGSLTRDYLISTGVKPENIFTGCMSADSEGLAASVAGVTHAERRELIDSLGLENHGRPDSITFMFVGQMIPRKGVDYLIKAWKRHIAAHPEDYLLLVGSGSHEDEYKELAADCPSIRFIGQIDYDSIHRYYAVSDVFVIPTLEDNWSLVVPEAMACGLPVACSIYNGCHPELVHSGVNGFTFDPLDIDSTAAALHNFHGQNLDALGRESVRIEQQFSTAGVARNIKRAITHFMNR